MAERKFAWPKQGTTSLLGKDIQRSDGPAKASGQAKYSADMNTPGTLYAKLLTNPHGHAKIAKLNVDKAKAAKGVKAVHIFRDVGTEVKWEGELIVAVAAERAELADDALKLIEITYEELPFFVDEADLKTAKEKELTKSLGTNTKGDIEAGLKDAKAVHKGFYGIHTITHMCLEPHGSHCQWDGDKLTAHLSTQNVSGTAKQFADPLGLDVANITVNCNYIGGGFGAKFQVDEWGLACAKMAKETGKPVRLMLDRATELQVAGCRPSAFAEVTVACDAEGNVTVWDSHHWGTGGGGVTGATVSLGVTPYVFDPPNRKREATGLICNTGPTRAWRAPNHPQACAYTQTALDDLAAKMKMDSLTFFQKNLSLTNKPEVFAAELELAAKLMDWKAKWHPRGEGKGPKKRGVGLALHTWGGGAHASTCQMKVHSDGTVETFTGSQDIGTGTRTAIAIVAAETFGIPLTAVKVNIGTNKYPTSGPSGGSTTIGGVSGPTRRAAQTALWKIFDLVAAKYNVPGENLVAKDGNILNGDAKVCTWKEAAGLIGPMALEVTGEGPKDDGLTSAQVGGVQMAEVEVDVETGIVRMIKMVAVQDIGLVVDRLTAKSQVLGAMIMGIASTLSEERIMDNKTGRFINANLADYKLPRIGDVGELVVEFYEPESEYNRGVIGLGEPPAISPGAAISNAVANALGVRVPVIPLTPKRVLDALKGAQA